LVRALPHPNSQHLFSILHTKILDLASISAYLEENEFYLFDNWMYP